MVWLVIEKFKSKCKKFGKCCVLCDEQEYK